MTAGGSSRFAHSTAALLLSTGILLLPLAGLALLLLQPSLDLQWQHHPSHFWLVLLASVLSAVLAYGMGVAATRRGDARVLLVSVAFLASAGFLGLHALATPGVLLVAPNAGFTVAAPVGLALGGGAAAASAAGLTSGRGLRVGRWSRGVLLAVMALWAAASLTRVPPLHDELTPEQANAGLIAIAIPGVFLYAAAAARYLVLWWRRPSLMLLSVLAAFVLLAEALIAVVFARSWHLSWWEWHLLMLAAFALVGLGARAQWHEERFVDLYTPDTTAGVREVSVLFADLQGFTTFSEQHPSREVSEMLNAYFAVTIPEVARRGGTVDRIVGDAVMGTFNSRGDQPDHARRAAAAALALQRAADRVATAHPQWPRFRVGVNTGPATVGVLGTEGGRTATIIGDTVNVAARIEPTAPPGGVAIGSATRDALPGARTEPLGRLPLKGKAEPVAVYRLLALDPSTGPGDVPARPD